ncbi:MAG: hypothetical protein A2Y50_14025 [Pseudomonadales bacterium RIFCSPLOWO2_12_59_9]|nr:MAG: hypothetical protein A2Y50_14025 [Pseudomonadales bacterium RIFCSPLOWO2_12_59_9]
MDDLSGKHFAWLWRGFLLLFVPVLVAMRWIDSGLQTSSAAHGIVSFEFCAFSASCAAQLQDWGARGQQLAMLSLGLDYLFIPLYAGLLWLALMGVAPLQPRKWQPLTRLMAYFALLAGLADTLENYALIQLLLNQSIEPFGRVAALCASLKFALLTLSFSGLLVGAGQAWRSKQRSG